MSVVISSSLLYPYPANTRRVVEPPGLTENLFMDSSNTPWSRLVLANGKAVDIAPETKVMTDQGWLYPESLLGRQAYVKVAILPRSVTIGVNTFDLRGALSLKVLSVELIAEPLAKVDTLSNDPELGGDSNSVTTGTETLNPIPEETCECVLTNTPCGQSVEDINDYASYPLT